MLKGKAKQTGAEKYPVAKKSREWHIWVDKWQNVKDLVHKLNDRKIKEKSSEVAEKFNGADVSEFDTFAEAVEFLKTYLP